MVTHFFAESNWSYDLTVFWLSIPGIDSNYDQVIANWLRNISYERAADVAALWIRLPSPLTARQGKFPPLLFHNHACYDLTVFWLSIPDIDPSYDQVIANA